MFAITGQASAHHQVLIGSFTELLSKRYQLESSHTWPRWQMQDCEVVLSSQVHPLEWLQVSLNPITSSSLLSPTHCKQHSTSRSPKHPKFPAPCFTDWCTEFAVQNLTRLQEGQYGSVGFVQPPGGLCFRLVYRVCSSKPPSLTRLQVDQYGVAKVVQPPGGLCFRLVHRVCSSKPHPLAGRPVWGRWVRTAPWRPGAPRSSP